MGQALYQAVLDLARGNGCYNVTLNVWSCNESAMRFYQKCGLKPQKVGRSEGFGGEGSGDIFLKTGEETGDEELSESRRVGG